MQKNTNIQIQKYKYQKKYKYSSSDRLCSTVARLLQANPGIISNFRKNLIFILKKNATRLLPHTNIRFTNNFPFSENAVRNSESPSEQSDFQPVSQHCQQQSNLQLGLALVCVSRPARKSQLGLGLPRGQRGRLCNIKYTPRL